MDEDNMGGAPYAKLAWFAKFLRTRQLSAFDNIIGVSGYKGVGKSTFGLQVVRKYQAMYFDTRYLRVKEVVAFSNEDVQDKLANMRKYGIFIPDEAARFAMGEDWMKADNKELKKILAQCREPKRLCALMNIPRLKWLDKKYLGGLIDSWVWIPMRGIAFVFLPDINPAEDDPWHLKEMRKSMKYINMFTDPDKIRRQIERHPCYLDTITFPKLPEKIYQRYLDLRTERTLGQLQRSYKSQRQLAFIAAANFYYRYEDITEAIKDTKQNRPTWRLLEEELFKDPKTGKGAIAFSSLRRNVKPLAEKHDMRLRAGEEGDEPEQKPEEKPELKPL